MRACRFQSICTPRRLAASTTMMLAILPTISMFCGLPISFEKRDLLAEGHEIQSHAYSHRPLFGMDRAALRQELELSVKTVEDACGVRVTSFRAPDFSILSENLWALETLTELGFKIDSSIFPMRMKRYGIAGWANTPSRITLPNGARLLEVPVAIWSVAGLRVPVAGGGYFRLLPQMLLSRALRSILAANQPVIIYCHPYEFNPRELDEFRGKVPEFFPVYPEPRPCVVHRAGAPLVAGAAVWEV